jgi:hypothetical protein
VILQANRVSASLTFLDFFSTNAQNAALVITANCCLNLHTEEFHFVKDSLPLLARLLENHGKKSVERICNAFYRLIGSFQHDLTVLQGIASMELTTQVCTEGTFTPLHHSQEVCSNQLQLHHQPMKVKCIQLPSTWLSRQRPVIVEAPTKPPIFSTQGATKAQVAAQQQVQKSH